MDVAAYFQQDMPVFENRTST